MRRARIALLIGFIALAVVTVAVLSRPVTDITTASPSPTDVAATTSSTPTAAPSPSPLPTPQGLYVSKRLAFALTLPPPWRKASCGNLDATQVQVPAGEEFTSAPVLEEHVGHAGRENDRVDVRLDANSERLTPTQFAQRRYSDATITAVTFAGRPAVEVRTSAFGPGDAIIYSFAEGDRMYSVSALPRTSALPDMPTMLTILRSFRLLSSAERLALPDPTPRPAAASTAQALAEALRTAFEQKNVDGLERLLGPCVSQGVVPGGGASEPRERFVVELRQQLAAGVTVTVDASAVQTNTGDPPYRYIWSKWNASPPGGGAPPASPSPQTYDVQLIFNETADGIYWSGTLLVFRF